MRTSPLARPLALAWQALLALTLLLAGLLPASAQPLLPVPALSARVIDQTATLSADERQALEAQLASIEQDYGAQVVVLLVSTTAPEDIAAFANRVGNTWKIGRRDVGDGVLVLVAKDERRMRIEVAKALEGAIPDIEAARIIDALMKPHFRDNDFAGGLQAAVEHLGARIAGEALPLPDSGGVAQEDLDWGDLAIFLFMAVMLLGSVARAIFGGLLGGLLLGGAIGWLAQLLTDSLLLGILAGLVTLLYTWVLAERVGTHIFSGGGGGGSGGDWGGGGGFSSGGGGNFGGGGASGDW